MCLTFQDSARHLWHAHAHLHCAGTFTLSHELWMSTVIIPWFVRLTQNFTVFSNFPWRCNLRTYCGETCFYVRQAGRKPRACQHSHAEGCGSSVFLVMFFQRCIFETECSSLCAGMVMWAQVSADTSSTGFPGTGVTELQESAILRAEFRPLEAQ